MVAAAVLLAERPGKASVDGAFGRSKWGTGWAVFAVLAGAIGSSLAIAAGRRFAPVASAEDDVADPDDTAEDDDEDTSDE